MIALEIYQLGQNNYFQSDQIAGGVLYLCYTLPWWIQLLHLQQLLPLVVVYAGPGAPLL